MKRRRVAVSHLADYAADPKGFAERRGRPRSRVAAKRGTQHHARLGRRPIPWGVIFLALALLIFFLWSSL